MKKTKVAHIITLLELGGAQQNTLHTVRHLDRTFFDVHLICGSGGILDIEAKNIPDLKLHFARYLVRPISPVNDFLAIIELYKTLRREKIQIVHTHSSKAGIVGRIAARLAGVPIIIHSIHGFGFNPYQKWFVRWIYIFLEWAIARFTTVLISVSARNIEDGLNLKIGHRKQYRLIRSGVNINSIRANALSVDGTEMRKSLNIAADENIIFTVGPFKPQKDPLSYIRLAKLVSEKIPKTKFLFAGDGTMRPEIEELIRQEKLQNVVKLLGWRRDVAQLMAICDVFVMTSLWEGLPRAVVEALIIGKPVVANAVDGVPEVVFNGKNGYALKPGDLSQMAHHISEILKDPALRLHLAQNAAKTIDINFDINHMVGQQEDLYTELSETIQ